MYDMDLGWQFDFGYANIYIESGRLFPCRPTQGNWCSQKY